MEQTFEIGNPKGLQQIAEDMGLKNFVTLDGFRLNVTCIPQQLVEMGMRLQRMNVIVDGKRAYRIACLKDNQENYEHGLLTTAEYEAQIEKISSEK